MIYLKTYCYGPHEIDFINLNLKESYDYIDKFIVCEYNRSHTGHEVYNKVFQDNIDKIDSDKLDKISYFSCDISEYTVFADTNEDAIHSVNEPVMRGFFTQLMDFKPDDIIISIDADEIIYGEMIPKIVEFVDKHTCTLLNLHQFFYGVNYFWEGQDFKAPTACKFNFYKNFPSQWRYDGIEYPEKAGCHFSWVMDIEAMMYKAQVYSHPRYRQWATREAFERSLIEKDFFHPESRKMNIKTLEFSKDTEIYPKKMFDKLETWEKYVIKDK
jgi:hypothetical protein